MPMRRPRHGVPSIETLRRWAVVSRPRCRCASSSAAHPERIAVLGGGVAGLSTAFFVAREFPRSSITVYEAGKDVGGWIRSRRVKVNGGDVLFELGPRTLRNATPTAHLIQELGLIDKVTYTSKSAPAAKNRYIYYPDRLNRLPAERPSLADLFALYRSGILAGTSALLTEPLTPGRCCRLDDETVGSFLERRFDKQLADNIVSAVFHGIYAGDIWQLSAKTLLALPWQLEGRYSTAMGGLFTLLTEAKTLAHPYDVDTARAANAEIDLDADWARKLSEASTITLRDGLQTLVDALQTRLMSMGNVVVKTACPVQSYKPVGDESQRIAVTTGPPSASCTSPYDLVLSSLRHPTLTPYVTVMTCSLFYPDPSITTPPGFGYLIPQSVPFDQNPERALGVIFDHHAASNTDSISGTKLTVMMGGHWWDGWTHYPSEAEGLHMARAVVQRHLGISADPATHCTTLSRECIPQYTLGYEGRVRAWADELKAEFGGRVRVVGSQVNGVGVNDCVTGAWNLARGLRGDGWREAGCGLEKVIDQREWRVVDVGELKYQRHVGRKGE